MLERQWIFILHRHAMYCQCTHLGHVIFVTLQKLAIHDMLANFKYVAIFTGVCYPFSRNTFIPMCFHVNYGKTQVEEAAKSEELLTEDVHFYVHFTVDPTT